MRSAELSRQANATLAYLERELRAQGYRFGWHETKCLVVAPTSTGAEKARRVVEKLLAQLGGDFRAGDTAVKVLPNGYSTAEFTLSSALAQAQPTATPET
jgi:hypothetical protein